MNELPQSWPALDRLREYTLARGPRAAGATERCECCGAEIEPAHPHLVNLATRTLLCACRGCHLLFQHDGAGGSRFRAVGDRYVRLSAASPEQDALSALDVPIGLAFFFRNSASGRVAAFYPSPGGATESELPLDAWDALVRAIPPLATLAPDVEALLVRRRTSDPQRVAPAATAGGVDALIAPIDACYELVGRIRRTWRGFHGGDDAWREIDEFFARAAARAPGAADA